MQDFALFCGPGTAASSEIKTHLFILHNLCNQCPNHNFWCSPCVSCPSWFHGWPFTARSTVQLSWQWHTETLPAARASHPAIRAVLGPRPHAGTCILLQPLAQTIWAFFFPTVTLSRKYKYTSLEEILIWHTAPGNMVTESLLLPCHFHSRTTAPLG